jgi:hypothetical protein
MVDRKSMLCVGGPLSGRRYEVAGGVGFTVPVAPLLDLRTIGPAMPDVVKVEFARYREERFHTPQGDVFFWTPIDQTALQTITLLLESYETRRREIGPGRMAATG